MNDLIILNKPYGVICQFSAHEKHQCLKDFVEKPGFYPAGRLDTDSEGLLLLTNNGRLQAQIADPKFKQVKTYWAQVEGSPDRSEAGYAAARGGFGGFCHASGKGSRIRGGRSGCFVAARAAYPRAQVRA